MSETKFTKGPWFVSGVRFKMNGGEWHGVSRYDEALKRDENIACVGFDPRTGAGFKDAHLIAAAPDLYEALEECVSVLTNPIVGTIHGDDPDWYGDLDRAVAKACAALSKVHP